MNINDLGFATDYKKAHSDFDHLLSLIGECKQHLFRNGNELDKFESEIVELVESIEEWQEDRVKEKVEARNLFMKNKVA